MQTPEKETGLSGCLGSPRTADIPCAPQLQACATGEEGSSLKGGYSEPAVARAAQAFCTVLRPMMWQSLFVTFAC